MTNYEIGAILFAMTALASYINDQLIALPKTIGLTFVTFVGAVILTFLHKMGVESATFLLHALQTIEFSEFFLHGMLGFLLFAAAFQVNFRDLIKYKTVISILSTFSVFISTFLVGTMTWVVMTFLNIPLSLPYCYLFGALISPTDPVAVLSILKTLTAPKSIEMKIAGEALFNDGMGIVLFVALSGLACKELPINSIEFICYFLSQAGGGILFGLLNGFFFLTLMRTTRSTFVMLLLSLATVTTGYTLAEHTHKISGVITVAVSGLLIGSQLRSKDFDIKAREHLTLFWEFFEEVLNALLFMFIGLEFLSVSSSAAVSVASFAIIGVVIVSRWISVFIPIYWISPQNYYRHYYTVWLLTWGGLRGGISIALALTIFPSSVERDVIIAITYSVVLFSIIVQGSTIGALVSLLTPTYQKRKIKQRKEFEENQKTINSQIPAQINPCMEKNNPA